MPHSVSRVALAFLAGLSAFPGGAALASGFALREGNPDWMANAFAGGAAKAYDASTAWANPAGMVRLNSNEIDAALNLLAPSARFHGENFVGPGIATPGTQGGNAIETAVTGGLYGVWNYAPDIKFGAAVDMPFALRTSYPTDFVGRYQSLTSSVTDVAVLLSFAWRINEHLSVGGGPVIDYFHARLTQAVNTGPTSVLTGDPQADVHGEDYSFGANLGVLYQFDSRTRIGLDYRSRIRHDLSGGQTVSIPLLIAALDPAAAGLLAAGNTAVSSVITLPDVVTLSFYRELSPEWAVMADLQWTHWSLLRNLVVTPVNGSPPTTLREDFRDTWFGSVGANYRPAWMPDLTLQAGLGYDQSPVTAATRTTRLPDYDRVLLGVGFTYAVSRGADLHMGYLHGFPAHASIDSAASTTSGRIVGSYHDEINTLSAGIALRF